MKKIFVIVMCMMTLLLCSCNLNTSGTKRNAVSDDQRYKIYRLASESGFNGTYEDWLESIQGDAIELKVDNNGNLLWKYSQEGEDKYRVLYDLSSLKGEDGHSPVITIGENGNWFIDGVDLNIKAKGEDGKDGQDGHTPSITIGANGNWYIDNVDTKVKAKGENGQDGHSPSITIGSNGNWYIDSVDTNVSALAENGQSVYAVYLKNHPDYNKSIDEWIEDLINGNLKEKEMYVVSFYDESTLKGTQSVEYGHLASSITSPTKDGYTFSGWYTTDNEKWMFSRFPVYGNISLYARWEKIEEGEIVDTHTIDLNNYSLSDKNALLSLTPDIIVLNNTFEADEKYKIVNSSNAAFDTKEYELNINMFRSINDALLAANENDNIYVFSGTYTDAISITKNNVNLLGANYNNAYNSVNRGNVETILENVVVSIDKEVTNINIKGFKFTKGSKIVNVKGTSGIADAPVTNIENFSFVNNVVYTTLKDTCFITFSENAHSYSKNISIIGNTFTNLYGISNMIKLDNNNGLTIKENEFMDIDGNAIYVTDTNKGLAGNLDMQGNVFSNITGSAFFANWYSPLPSTTPSLLVKGNIFESVNGSACIDFEKCNEADKSLYTSFKVEENIFKDVFKCFYKYNNTNAEFKHNIVYQYNTIPTTGYVVSLNANAVDVSENLYLSKDGANVITSVYSTSTTDNNGFRFSSSIDETNTNASNYSSKGAYNAADYAVKTFTYDGYFTAEYDSNSYVEKGGSIELVATFTNASSSALVFESLDTSIATVSGTTVTGVNSGNVIIRCYLNNQKSTHVTFIVTVVESEISEALNFILSSHNSNIHVTKNLKVDGNAPFYIDAIGSVSDALFGDELTIDTSYEAVQNANTNSNHGGTKSSTEFITVHYTASNGASAGAKSHASYFANNTSTSIHYTTGNDGVYHILDDSLIAYHAGDGTRGMTWTKTGVAYQVGDPKYPTFGISSDSYFTINGKKTSIAVPTGDTDLTKKVTDSRFINDMGLPFKIVNGEYYMGRTWWCYTQVAEGRICSTGGNANSIGIETSVNKGSDLWLTWHKTAQLVAKLMKDNNLDITRVVGHHFYSAKNCPQPLLENDLELWWKFIEMVEAEYAKLTNYSNYEFTLNVVNSSGILATNGRINNLPTSAKSVLYEIVITNKTTGATSSVMLSSLVKGNN